MIFYVSSNWGSQQRMQDVRFKLRALGHEVRSGWLDEAEAQSFESLSPAMRQEFSYRDLGEVLTADILTIDTAEMSLSGGREVEFGAAVALGKETWLVGQPRNIFHTIAKRQFADWGDVFAYLLKEGI